MSSLAEALWIVSGPQTIGALADLFQSRFKRSQLFRAHSGKDFPDFGCVFTKNRRDQPFALGTSDTTRTRRSS
jgi:hypothetical protein